MAPHGPTALRPDLCVPNCVNVTDPTALGTYQHFSSRTLLLVKATKQQLFQNKALSILTPKGT